MSQRDGMGREVGQVDGPRYQLESMPRSQIRSLSLQICNQKGFVKLALEHQ